MVYLRTVRQKQNMASANLAQLSSERVYVLLTNCASKAKHEFSKTCSFVRRKSLGFAYELCAEKQNMGSAQLAHLSRERVYVLLMNYAPKNKTWVQHNLLICPAKEFMFYLRA